MPRLTLMAPGLVECGGGLRNADLPGWSALSARGRRVAVAERSYEALLLRLFGVSGREPGTLPVAPVTRLADTGRRDEGWWVRADPVHLRPDRDRLLVIGGALLDLQPAEALAMAREINQALGDGRWTLETPCPQRWYLGLSEDPRLAGDSLPEVLGRTIDSRSLGGLRADSWQGLLTEIQMLLASTKANEVRQARGALPINSLWFWGAGRLPAQAQCPYDRLFGDEPLLCGLARLAALAAEPCPAGAEAWMAGADGGEHLAVLGDLRMATAGDDGPAAIVRRWDERWLQPLLSALRRRRLQRLVCYGGEGIGYELTPSDAWRWWRRPRRGSAC
jgi:hypothetical protein